MPKKRVMECILPASSSPANQRARGREPIGLNGPPRRPSPLLRAGESRWCAPASCEPPSEAPACGCCRGRRRGGVEGGTTGGGAGRGAPLVAGGEGDDGSRGAGAAEQFWARIPSPCVAAQLSTPGPRQQEPGEKSAAARLLEAASWMRDLRGLGGGQRL